MNLKFNFYRIFFDTKDFENDPVFLVVVGLVVVVVIVVVIEVVSVQK